MKLEDLCGQRVVSARGESVGDETTVLLRLDGVVYAFQEDPEDGYRSMLGDVRVATPEDLTVAPLNEFPGIPVALTTETEGSYLVATTSTGHELFRIGTDYRDSWYPSFVATWNPELS